MARILVCYYSRTGNTKKMAEYIGKGIEKEGLEVDISKVKNVTPDDLIEYEGIIFGSPTYYGTLAGEIKNLIDKSVKHHGKLEGIVGGAFTSSAGVAGGNETTILSIINALLIHGMVVMGDPKDYHYGPVSIGKPDRKVEEECIRYGMRFAKLVKKLHPRA